MDKTNDDKKESSPDDVFHRENNFEMALQGEGFDATIEINEEFHDTQLVSNPKMNELLLANSRHVSVRSGTEDTPKINEIAGKACEMTEVSLNTNANGYTEGNQSTNLVNSEKTENKSVPSDQKLLTVNWSNVDD